MDINNQTDEIRKLEHRVHRLEIIAGLLPADAPVPARDSLVPANWPDMAKRPVPAIQTVHASGPTRPFGTDPNIGAQPQQQQQQQQDMQPVAEREFGAGNDGIERVVNKGL